ncbi:hypothetical protein BDD12DRAFT_901522 [Trichophaea hybrida]|nr:hypothetical protein BDD12DRAFT_901522 [Trichophaea hybrida]
MEPTIPPTFIMLTSAASHTPSPTQVTIRDFYRRRLPVLPPSPLHILNPLEPQYLGQIPCSYTTRKLQDLGDGYLKDIQTVDAYIRAIPMKRPQLGLVRVRVLPKQKGRKVVVMQKRFPLQCSDIRFSPTVKPLQSPMPIHIEYALYRVPLLAAILLSGHVRKGDTVEVPVPHPGVWTAVMEWVYTGRGCVVDNRMLADNLRYLGARL